MKKVIFDRRWEGGHGIGRFSSEITKRVSFDAYIRINIKPTSPIDIFVTPWFLFFNKSIYFTPGFNAPWLFVGRSVITVHDLNHIDISGNDSRLKSLYYDFVLKRACRKSLVVFTVSEFSKKRIVAWADVNPEKVIVVGNGVSKEFCPAGEAYNPGFKYFLCVSNRKAHKNEERLITAFSMVKNRGDIKLLLTGKETPELRKHIASLGISNDVIFSGFIDEEKLPSFYRGATALLMPSLYEGFGLPVIEAMACGIPTVVSNTTALNEIAEGYSVLVNPEDVGDIAKGIGVIIEDETLVNRLKVKGLQQAGNFTWDKTVSLINRAMNNLKE